MKDCEIWCLISIGLTYGKHHTIIMRCIAWKNAYIYTRHARILYKLKYKIKFLRKKKKKKKKIKACKHGHATSSASRPRHVITHHIIYSGPRGGVAITCYSSPAITMRCGPTTTVDIWPFTKKITTTFSSVTFICCRSLLFMYMDGKLGDIIIPWQEIKEFL